MYVQFDELEELGFIGFALAFLEEKSQIVGASSTLHCFSPQIVEYLHALLITGIMRFHIVTIVLCMAIVE